MGDPAGVGPEIAAKALADPTVRENARPLVIGDARVMRAAARVTQVTLEVRPLAAPGDATFAADRIEVLDLGNADRGVRRGPGERDLRPCGVRVHRARRAPVRDG
jgi:4-hydroxythreonine-4-phosphate dehydrogenase